MIRTVALPNSTNVPALGLGTWRMGEDNRLRKQEIEAIRAGIDLGMTLIDTAEMYGDGATEQLLGEALKSVRDKVFLVSKVYPQNAGRGRIEKACEASLRRLSTDRLDLYLLHWRGGVPLAEVVECMKALVVAGVLKAATRGPSRRCRVKKACRSRSNFGERFVSTGHSAYNQIQAFATLVLDALPYARRGRRIFPDGYTLVGRCCPERVGSQL